MSMLSYEEFRDKYFMDSCGYPKKSFYIETDNGLYYEVPFARCNIVELYGIYRDGFLKKEKYLDGKFKKFEKKLDEILTLLNK